MKQHELDTLNATREENIKLKERNEALHNTNIALTNAIDAVYTAISEVGGSDLVQAITASARESLGLDASEQPVSGKRKGKRNTALQLVPPAALQQ